MRYASTRKNSPLVSLSDGLTAGLAPDGGLYLPETLPQIDAAALHPTDPHGIARAVLAPFLAGDRLEEHLDAIVADAFAPPFPIVPTKDPRLHVLELFHGPTAAFKDFGARFLAACLARLDRPPLTTILVATSGDTGGAVAAAFHGRPGFRVVVLYPDGRVSPRQAHQLEAFGGNVVTLRVDGTFDDCQALVKAAFADEALRSDVPMTSANSISLGRLLPQMVYHAVASVQIAAEHGPVGLVVPTGNLGNALAAWLAGALGLPIHHIVLATNANDAVVQWHRSGDASPRLSVPTLANAMDVGVPSNLERLRHLLSDEVPGPDLSALATDDATIRTTLAAAPERYGHVVCPHTACALHAYEQLDVCRTGPWIAAATAHPAKFDTVVEPVLGHTIPVPEELAKLLAQPRKGHPMANDLDALKDVLRS
jgi:threonine synthase